MPVYDHRVFKSGSEWWIAEVHISSGSADSDGRRIMHRDEVTFTCLTSQQLFSKQAEVPSGSLNLLKHSAIVELLNTAMTLDTRFDMHPYNAPPEPEAEDAVFIDEQGIRWILKSITLPFLSPNDTPKYGVEVICLDDSAVRTTIGMQDRFTFREFVQSWEYEAKIQLINLVNEQYRDLPSVRERRRHRVQGINPLDVIAKETDVTLGTRPIHSSMPVLFAAPDIILSETRYKVNAGIKNHKVFAGTIPRNEVIELIIINVIENHPDNAYDLRQIESRLDELDSTTN